MKIEITIDQYNKMRRLSDFADWYLDDHLTKDEQYESDKEEVLQAQEVLQDIDASISLTTPKFEPAQEEV